jgi:hypothetical protein
MKQANRFAACSGAVVGVLVVMLAGSMVEPAAGQTDEPHRAVTEVPGLLGCSSTPYFALSDQVPLTGGPLAWWAAGLQPSSQAAIAVTDIQNPQTTLRSFATVDGQCQASGFINLPFPRLYQVQITATAATGDTVNITAWARAVTGPTPIPTPLLTVPPSGPTNVRATVMNATTVRIDWDATVANQTGFLITSRAGQLRQGPDARTATVGGLVPGAIYCFSVYAVNDAGATLGGVDCAFPPLSPTATPATTLL